MKIGDLEINEPRILADEIVDQITGESDKPDGYLMISGQAEGAIPNGTRIQKIWSEEGDTFPLGTQGTILSSLGPITEDMVQPGVELGEFGYFISWDPFPNTPVFTIGKKIESVKEES